MPSSALMGTLVQREDEQIMGQELLAILLGLCTFKPFLKDKLVRVWTDNTGGEGAMRTGAAKCSDHNLIVHDIWLCAASIGCGLWVERVGTHDNIADDPSRESYGLLQALGARWIQPVLPWSAHDPKKWAEWGWLAK